MKRRKDSGFTLIELMIVIAVIGILAIVLVPKVGTVKTQSKETGLDVNNKLVQGYIESKITKWVSKNTPAVNTAAATTTIAEDIVSAFTGTNKSLTNPITSVTAGALGPDTEANAAQRPVFVMNTTTGAAPSNNPALKGTIVVSIAGTGDADDDGAIDGTETAVSAINIYSYDGSGNLIADKNIIVYP